MDIKALIELAVVVICTLLLLALWYYTQDKLPSIDDFIVQMYDKLGYLPDKLTVDSVGNEFITIENTSTDPEHPNYQFVQTITPFNLLGDASTQGIFGSTIDIKEDALTISNVIKPLQCGATFHFDTQSGVCIPNKICNAGDHIKNIDYGMFHALQVNAKATVPYHPKLFVECKPDQTYTLHTCPEGKITSGINTNLDTACIYTEPCQHMINYSRHVIPIVPLAGNEYFVCIDKHSVKQACTDTQYFNPRILTCVDMDPCTGKADDTFIRQVSDNSYIACKNQVSTTVYCNYGIENQQCKAKPPPPPATTLIYWENANFKYPVGYGTTTCPGQIVTKTYNNLSPSDYAVNSPSVMTQLEFNTAFYDGTTCTTRNTWSRGDLIDLPTITLTSILPTFKADPELLVGDLGASIYNTKIVGHPTPQPSSDYILGSSCIPLTDYVKNSSETSTPNANDGLRLVLHSEADLKGHGAVCWVGSSSNITCAVAVVDNNKVKVIALKDAVINTNGVLNEFKTNIVRTNLTGAYATNLTYNGSSWEFLTYGQPSYMLLAKSAGALLTSYDYSGTVDYNAISTYLSSASTPSNWVSLASILGTGSISKVLEYE